MFIRSFIRSCIRSFIRSVSRFFTSGPSGHWEIQAGAFTVLCFQFRVYNLRCQDAHQAMLGFQLEASKLKLVGRHRPYKDEMQTRPIHGRVTV